MELSELKSGIIITGPKWPEPIHIKKMSQTGSYIHIVGSTTLSNEHIDQIIPFADLSNIDIQTISTDFKSEAWKVFLALETKRYRFASLYDPLLAMNASKVDPLPHQIEAVYGYVLKMPRIRFLLAHDPGAGKTIMAGLIIKELKMRKVIKRILIVVPGHLKDQWRRELKDRFEETFVVVGRSYLGAHYAENVWEKENQIITSIDFAKREEVLPSLDSSEFDMIIVDEAHKMSAYRYGDKTEKTGRYRLGEILSRISEHFLFLTATPHKGDPENFRLFLDLLEPGFFATSEMLKESIENQDNPLFLRRIKEDMKDFEGKPLFVPRNVLTPDIRLSDSEKELYNEVSLYVKEQFNKALTSDKKRNVGFALLILQRRLASSTFALLKSLERRKQKLEDMGDMVDSKNTPAPKSFDFEEAEDMSEEERWKEEELWETLSVAENREELEKEIRTLIDLISKAKEVIKQETESKLLHLKDTMNDLEQTSPNEKILIFTESKDTLEYLEKKIVSWGYSVNTIHGGMQLEERVEAETIFKNQTQVMVATEAAGEGINLQFCHLMINYDLPWNPNRLEQRMGRIHRYGQQFEVFVFNLVASDTREGQVLTRLFQKLNEIKIIMKSDKVFDVISEILYGKNLAQLMLDAASNARDQEEILKELDFKVDEEYITQIRENLGESLATKYMDYTRLKDMRAKARENRLIPEYTEALFKKAFSNAGGKFHNRSDEFTAIDSIPYEIKNIANEDNFKKSFGSLLKTYSKITFDKDIGFKHQDAEFVTFGHPLFESTLEWIDRTFGSEAQKGATFIDPDGKLNGYIIFHEGEIKDGTGEIAGKKLFAHYVDLPSNQAQSISPTIIWDLIESDEKNNENIELETMKENVLSDVIQSLEEYSNKLQKERIHQSEIKQKYGVQSLRKLIIDLDNDLVELQIRKEKGDNVDLAIRNKRDRKRKYEENKKELESLIQKEQSLTMSMPSFFGIIRVKPSVTVRDDMHRDPAIEAAGMRIAMQYERDAGRTPEDVSKENLGFDVRSIDENGNFRYIEVKARAGVGSVALTTNEWFKALHLGDDFYLYVVWNAEKDPDSKPLIIRNPAKNLSVNQEVVRYFIDPEEIREKAE